MKTNKFPLFVLAAFLVFLISACAPQQKGSAKAELPVDKGFAEGNEIYFTHTEVSDAITNGVKGGSMSGLQPSVFDNPPGTEGYSPLRRLNVVTWADPAKACELRTAAQILQAADAGELTITQPGVVINMPFIIWEGGKR